MIRPCIEGTVCHRMHGGTLSNASVFRAAALPSVSELFVSGVCGLDEEWYVTGPLLPVASYVCR